jgi:ABC-type hemin transport system ATPase subunit
VNLTVRPKDFIAIIVPNGGGKTTPPKLILGLLTPVKGTVHLDGKPPQEASQCIGYVPQNVHSNHSFPITAIDVVLMGNFEFMRNALIAGLLASVICGIMGTLVVVNRLVFLSGGIAPAAYGGIGLAFYFKYDLTSGASIIMVSGIVFTSL